MFRYIVCRSPNCDSVVRATTHHEEAQTKEELILLTELEDLEDTIDEYLNDMKISSTPSRLSFILFLLILKTNKYALFKIVFLSHIYIYTRYNQTM